VKNQFRHFTNLGWERLWNRLGETPRRGFGGIESHYSEPRRHYHTARHIDECLAEFELIRARASNPVALELAIWLHDIVYDPKAADNEEQSARFAVDCLNNAPPELASLVSQLILTTKHHSPANTPDAPVLIDIDLNILGKPPEKFAEYERQIREEYAWVPLDVFCEKRATILREFLGRERIFRTPLFYERYEIQARENLAQSIADLERQRM
jgi:predicted metal-dependent HD superfamily phosphohydrolase